MQVDGLPAGFDRTDERFAALELKWNIDRDGQDWPTPRYVPTAGGGYMIIAENVFDHGEGPFVWGMAVASSEWSVIAPASVAC